MKTIALLASLAVCASTGAFANDAEEVTRERAEFEVAHAVAAQNPSGSPPNTCGAAPLPTTPTGPSTTATFSYGSSMSYSVTAWRIPCSPTESMVVLTLAPLTLEPFACSANLALLQSGGLQTELIFANPDPSAIDSFCGDVLQPISVSVYPRPNFPTNFDLDLGFTIDHDGSSAGHQQLAVLPFNPADYSMIPPVGTDTVNVFVRGTNQQFRNCVVQSAGVGGGIQYTASCDDETPLKYSGFTRFDY